MKEQYENPKMEIVSFAEVDVICTSDIFTRPSYEYPTDDWL